MPQTKLRKREYMRAYAARARLYTRFCERLTPHMDGQGFVSIRMTTTLRWRGLDLGCGEVCRLHWKQAAQMIAGAFAELAPDAALQTAAERTSLVETLRILDRAADGIARQKVKDGKAPRRAASV